MQEPKLRELVGPSRLALGFFNSLIRRIECTKPIAGNGISIQQQADGILISTSGALGGRVTTASIVVCENGNLKQITILTTS